MSTKFFDEGQKLFVESAPNGVLGSKTLWEVALCNCVADRVTLVNLNLTTKKPISGKTCTLNTRELRMMIKNKSLKAVS